MSETSENFLALTVDLEYNSSEYGREYFMVVTDKTLARINELAKKAKTEGLTDEEIAERDLLRQEYLRNFRKNFRNQMEQIQIVEPDGSITPVVRKNKNGNLN